MNVLLLGSNGQLGSDIIKSSSIFPNIEITSLIRSNLDVSNYKTIESVIGSINFDVLVNCTSYHKTDEVEDNPSLALDINSYAVMEMAKICNKKDAIFMHISTDYVFNGLAKSPYREKDSTGPLNVYGLTKLMGENLAFLNHNKVIVFRVASLFGLSGASGKGGNFVETMINLGNTKDSITVVSDQYMSPTSTKNISNVILSSIVNGIPEGIYHLVNGGKASWHEFASKIFELSDIDCAVEKISSLKYKTRAIRPSFSVLDNSKISDIIGPISNWEEALEEYLLDRKIKK